MEQEKEIKKEGLTAEEKEAQITETIEHEEGKPLTEEEEFKILKGKGIEFKADELIMIIPPLKLNQVDKLHEIEKELKGGTGDDNDKFKNAIRCLSELINVSVEDMGKNLYTSDVFLIMRLLTYSFLHGRKMFEKDSVKKKDILNIDLKNLM